MGSKVGLHTFSNSFSPYLFFFEINRSSLFKRLKVPSTIILNIIEVSSTLPPTLREGFLRVQNRMLIHRVLGLISLTEVEKKKHNGSALDVSVVMQIREHLSLTQDSDFKVMLAIAGKLSPGIYKQCLGDPDMIEEKFIDLFQGW